MRKSFIKSMVLTAFVLSDVSATYIIHPHHNHHHEFWHGQEQLSRQHHINYHVYHQQSPIHSEIRYFHYPHQHLHPQRHYQFQYDTDNHHDHYQQQEQQHVYRYYIQEENSPENYIKYRIIYKPEDDVHHHDEVQFQRPITVNNYTPHHKTRDAENFAAIFNTKRNSKQENVKEEVENNSTNMVKSNKENVTLTQVEVRAHLDNENNKQVENGKKCDHDSKSGKCIDVVSGSEENTTTPPSADVEVGALDKVQSQQDVTEKIRPTLPALFVRFGGDDQKAP